MLKNEAAVISKTVRRLRCESLLLLTGTPLQNNLRELWALHGAGAMTGAEFADAKAAAIRRYSGGH